MGSAITKMPERKQSHTRPQVTKQWSKVENCCKAIINCFLMCSLLMLVTTGSGVLFGLIWPIFDKGCLPIAKLDLIG